MRGILTLLARVADVARAPRCAVCGDATRLVAEETVPGTPQLLESVFRCPACGTSVVRCLVAAATD
jgi:hypothetical protein